ncbi:MAG: signal peptidase I [Acidobacteria bacterium]|nr:signal peptidase I [Acidobacteriota bacterium]
MTITTPDLTSDQERPDDGLSLLADPWTDEWALPTKTELVAVGWPGARPGQSDGSGILELVPDPVDAEQILDPVADMPVAERLDEPSGDVLTEPATYEPGPLGEEPSPPIPLRSVAGTPQIADRDVLTEPTTSEHDQSTEEPLPPDPLHPVETTSTPQIADPGVLTEPATPEADGSPDELESVIDFTEPKQKRSRQPKRTRARRNRTPKWIRRHLNSRRRLRLVIATVATAYWYFAVATLAITVLVPLAAGWTTSTVMSNSMGPTVAAGDVVAFSAYDGSQLAQGTIILFDDPTRENSSLMHRVVALNPDGTYETKGDANQGSDSTQVPVESIVGMARMISPYGGLPHFWLNTGQYVWLAGWILLTAAAAMLMSPGRDPEEPSAQPVPEGETPPVRQRPIRRASTYGASEA